MRLLITRPLEDSKPLKKKLAGLGHRVWSLPMIEIKPPKDGGRALQNALENISQYQWLILTSQNTTRVVKVYLKKFPKNLKVARVGKEGVAGLIRFFKNKNLAGQKILYPMSQIGRKELVAVLKKKGAKVDVIEAYQTKPANVSAKRLKATLKKGIDAVLFFSPSAVESFFSKIKRRDPLLAKINFIAWGKTTASSLKQKGIRPEKFKFGLE